MSTDKLPDGWTRVKFGDVVRNANENSRDLEGDGIDRVVGLDHLDPGSLRLVRWDNVADLPDGTTFTRKFKPGQVLFGKRRVYQRKVAVPDFEGVCSGDILVFEPADKRMLPEFLPYMVQSDGFFDHALGTSAGSLSPRTKWAELAKYEFELPPVDEQQRIASVLQAAVQVSDLGEGVVQAASDMYRALGSSLIGEATEMVALGTVLDRLIDHRGKTPSKLGTQFVPDGVPVVSALNVRDFHLDLAEARFVSDDTWRRWMPEPLAPGDLLLTSEAPLGRSVVLTSEEPLCLGQRLYAIRGRTDLLIPAYLKLFLDSPQGQAALASRATGNTVKGIRASELVKVVVPLRPLEEQARLVSVAQGALRIREAGLSHRSRCAESMRVLRESMLGGSKV